MSESSIGISNIGRVDSRGVGDGLMRGGGPPAALRRDGCCEPRTGRTAGRVRRAKVARGAARSRYHRDDADRGAEDLLRRRPPRELLARGVRERRLAIDRQPGRAEPGRAARCPADRPIEAPARAHTAREALLRRVPRPGGSLRGPRAPGQGPGTGRPDRGAGARRGDLLGGAEPPDAAHRRVPASDTRWSSAAWTACTPARSSSRSAPAGPNWASSRSRGSGRTWTSSPGGTRRWSWPPRPATPCRGGGHRRRPARRGSVRPLRSRLADPPGDRPPPEAARGAGRDGPGIRQHREHQAGRRGRRRGGDPAAADPGTRGRLGHPRGGPAAGLSR